VQTKPENNERCTKRDNRDDMAPYSHEGKKQMSNLEYRKCKQRGAHMHMAHCEMEGHESYESSGANKEK